MTAAMTTVCRQWRTAVTGHNLLRSRTASRSARGHRARSR
jgi:hypothetical protein